MLRIGLISDTHDLLRPEALAALQGSDLLIHAGDVCSAPVLDTLARCAPLTAVRGNNDRGAWADGLPATATVDAEGVRVLVVHDLKSLRGVLPPGTDVVVSGHSHRPLVQRRDGVLYVNPGSAGPRRFRLPVAVGRLVVDGRTAGAEILELPVVRTL